MRKFKRRLGDKQTLEIIIIIRFTKTYRGGQVNTELDDKVHVHVHQSFKARARLAQQWLVCAPLGIHLEPINRLLVTRHYLTQRENCAVPNKKAMVHHMSLLKP